jgi:hypothetical protein
MPIVISVRFAQRTNAVVTVVSSKEAPTESPREPSLGEGIIMDSQTNATLRVSSNGLWVVGGPFESRRIVAGCFRVVSFVTCAHKAKATSHHQLPQSVHSYRPRNFFNLCLFPLRAAAVIVAIAGAASGICSTRRFHWPKPPPMPNVLI